MGRDLLMLDRFFYLALGAITLIALGSLTAWLRIPGMLVVASDSTLHVVPVISRVEWTWRCVGGGFALLAALAVARGAGASQWFRRAAWMYLVFSLCFPSVLAKVEPDVFARARSMYWSMERTVADMENNVAQEQTAWRRFQVFSPDTYPTVETRTLIGPDLGADVLLGGYWTAFVHYHLSLPVHYLQLISFSPLFTVLGAIALVIAVYQLHPFPWRALADDGRAIFVILAVAGMCVLAPKLGTGYALEQVERGRALTSIDQRLAWARRAHRWDPTQRYSMASVGHLGQRYSDAGFEEHPAAYVSRAYALIRVGAYRSAVEEIESARRRYPDDASLAFFESVVDEEAGREAFDQGQTTMALRYWQMAQTRERLSAFALYGESLARLRSDDLSAASRDLFGVRDMQMAFGFKRLTIGGQAYLMDAWRKFRDGPSLADAQAAYAYAHQPDRW